MPIFIEEKTKAPIKELMDLSPQQTLLSVYCARCCWVSPMSPVLLGEGLGESQLWDPTFPRPLWPLNSEFTFSAMVLLPRKPFLG